MKKTIVKWTVAGVLMVGCASIGSKNAHAASFQEWLHGVRQEAIQQGISQQTINEVFPHLSVDARVIKLDRKQPDGRMSFEQYEQMILPQSRITKARKLYAENKALLTKIGKQYGVQPQFIVALWGVESNFGENMGGFSVMNSLATLAFEGRRHDFFRAEFINGLKIIDQDHIRFKDMKGSWAGAMGQSQFMPSSFLKYAVDYTKDGTRDIWRAKADVFASIANYLHSEGWDANQNWGTAVTLPPNFDLAMIDPKRYRPMKEWRKLGVTYPNGKPVAADVADMALMRPAEQSRQLFLVSANYRTILHWNRSLYFATTVGKLADSIAAH